MAGEPVDNHVHSGGGDTQPQWNIPISLAVSDGSGVSLFWTWPLLLT